jgi:hypothetical protein
MLGGCNHEYHEYEAEKAKELESLRAKLAEFQTAFQQFVSFYEYDGSSTIEMLKREVAGSMLRGSDRILNYFEYDTVYYNRCGDRDGEASGLLTWLEESELKKHMAEYARKNKGNYCHHKFLASMSDYGITMRSYESLPEMYGANTISLSHISEKDIYSSEEFAEIEKIRAEEARKKKEAEDAARLAATEKREREEFERLKKKFEKENCNV